MKYKLIILVIISSFIIYITYNCTYKKRINIVSINTLEEKENYNNYLSELLSKSDLNYNFNIDFSNYYLEIENIISKIDNNENNLHTVLKKADILILSIGNNDYLTEELNTILNETELLLKKIRLLNNKQIIYISPSNTINTIYTRYICKKYNVIFINGYSFKNYNNNLAQLIYKKIEKNYIK